MTSSSNKEIKAIHPPNLGWLEYRLNEEEMKHVRECISKAHVDFKPKLAGNIHGSYVLEDEGDWFWNNTLKVLCTTYQEAFKINLGDLVPTGQGYPYFLQTWWVNIRNKLILILYIIMMEFIVLHFGWIFLLGILNKIKSLKQ